VVGYGARAVDGGVTSVLFAASETSIVGHKVSSDFRSELGNSGGGGGIGGLGTSGGWEASSTLGCLRAGRSAATGSRNIAKLHGVVSPGVSAVGGDGAGEVGTIAMAHYGIIHLIGQVPDVVPSHI
jgi:hypothetical protein